MDNSNLSTLIYRIIGKPEYWHHDYLDMMEQILAETESFERPETYAELEMGGKILEQLSTASEAMTAFGTLLDRSRFKMIILDKRFSPIYHNQNAEQLFAELQCKNGQSGLDVGILSKAQKAIDAQNAMLNSQDFSGKVSLVALGHTDKNGDEVYLRSIQNQVSKDGAIATFYLLLVLDQDRHENHLNSEFVDMYGITEKEERVLLKLIHGNGIKSISQELFVSENTVKTHLKSLFRKTDTKSQADIIRLALTHESQILDSYFGVGAGLAASRLNSHEDKFITLDSGTQIAYREYGPEDGYPVVMYHSGWGCRITVPHNYEEALERLNKKLIIADRPGIGQSTFVRNHPKNWVKAMNELIDKWELKEYDLLGNIIACAMTMEFAAQADERLKKVTLMSPVLVNTWPESKHLSGILAPSTKLVKASSRFAREIYLLWLKNTVMSPETKYRSLLDRTVGSAEIDLFVKTGTFDLMIESFREASAKSVEAIAHEMVYNISPRKLDLAKLTVPVELWWGTEDTRITQEGVENIAAQLPNVTLNIREGYSEHIYYALFEEILS